MKAVTPESLWHVFIMFWALPYFFTQHNVGAHLVPPSSGPGLGPFPRVLAPFREERYLATKIYTLGALISTGMLLPSGCQWTHLGTALGREAVPLRFCVSKLIEIHPISTWHHTFILVFSLPVIVIPFSEVRNLASIFLDVLNVFGPTSYTYFISLLTLIPVGNTPHSIWASNRLILLYATPPRSHLTPQDGTPHTRLPSSPRARSQPCPSPWGCLPQVLTAVLGCPAQMTRSSPQLYHHGPHPLLSHTNRYLAWSHLVASGLNCWGSRRIW